MTRWHYWGVEGEGRFIHLTGILQLVRLVRLVRDVQIDKLVILLLWVLRVLTVCRYVRPLEFFRLFKLRMEAELRLLIYYNGIFLPFETRKTLGYSWFLQIFLIANESQPTFLDTSISLRNDTN
mmetsp:Transcript_18728/g.28730  ORF Transcript_18728/g.28730 Transcript_18728/m.28730 type:complete len:124 (-) Transcript_18728:550-921(-)